MATLTAPRPPAPLLTIEDVLNMPDSKNYELIDGVLKERAVSITSDFVGSRFAMELGLQAGMSGGWAFGGGPSLALWPRRPNHFVRPDASYFTADQFGGGPLPKGTALSTAPALVVEVISPGDRDGDVSAKIADYLEAGVRMLWVVYPERSQVHVYRPGQRVVLVQDGEELTGGDVLPGFRVDLPRLMPPVAASPAASEA